MTVQRPAVHVGNVAQRIRSSISKGVQRVEIVAHQSVNIMNSLTAKWGRTGLLKRLEATDACMAAYYFELLAKQLINDYHPVSSPRHLTNIIFPIQRRIFPYRLSLEDGYFCIEGHKTKWNYAEIAISIKDIIPFSALAAEVELCRGIEADLKAYVKNSCIVPMWGKRVER